MVDFANGDLPWNLVTIIPMDQGISLVEFRGGNGLWRLMWTQTIQDISIMDFTNEKSIF